MFTTSRWRKVIAYFVLLVEILALILIIFGLYIRLSGTGNPVGSVYILVGGALGVGGGIIIFFVSRRPKWANRHGKTQQMRQSRRIPKDE